MKACHFVCEHKSAQPTLGKPSAFPQTLLTVSYICLFSLMVMGALVGVVLIVDGDANGLAAREISAGLNDD